MRCCPPPPSKCYPYPVVAGTFPRGSQFGGDLLVQSRHRVDSDNWEPDGDCLRASETFSPFREGKHPCLQQDYLERPVQLPTFQPASVPMPLTAAWLADVGRADRARHIFFRGFFLVYLSTCFSKLEKWTVCPPVSVIKER